MRAIPPALQAKLDQGVTTLCTCWQVDRKKGPPLGFTDHDRDLTFNGVTFEAASGFEASAIERSLGLSIDNMSATGALRSDRLSEEDIARGRFDGARVIQWQVDWTDPEMRILTFRGEIGEIKRGVVGFEVELRGLAEVLNRVEERRYLPVCDARLGDSACRALVDVAEFTGEGQVIHMSDARSLLCAGLDSYAPGWFRYGELTWLDGPDASDVLGIRQHGAGEIGVTLNTDRDLPASVIPGRQFRIVAGCDKRESTCREKFQNIRNFRGFPHIPGESWLAAYPVDGGRNDGGSRSDS